ncbi:MAG: hypothetical protein Q4G45_04435 [Actinomycetia bacterium]|nr:hypothetical protein [Actinomycetes bacterium]
MKTCPRSDSSSATARQARTSRAVSQDAQELAARTGEHQTRRWVGRAGVC